MEDLQDMFINSTIGVPVGIITIEDVIEELLGDEIIDETDRFVDNMKTSKVDPATLREHLPQSLRTLLNWGSFMPRGQAGKRGLGDLQGAAQPLLDAEGGDCVLWRSRPSTPVRAGDMHGKVLQGPFVSSFMSPLRQQAEVGGVVAAEASGSGGLSGGTAIPPASGAGPSGAASVDGGSGGRAPSVPSAKAIGDAISKLEQHFQSNPELSDAIVTLQAAEDMSAFVSAAAPVGRATGATGTLTAPMEAVGPPAPEMGTRGGQGTTQNAPGHSGASAKSLVPSFRAAAAKRSASVQLREKHLRALEQRAAGAAAAAATAAAPTPPPPLDEA